MIFNDKNDRNNALTTALVRPDVKVTEVTDARLGLNMIFDSTPDIIFLSMSGDEYYWPQALSQVSGKAPACPVIVFSTGDISIEEASLSFQMGAFDCLSLQTTPDKTLLFTVERAIGESKRRRQEQQCRERLEKKLADSEKTISRLKSELDTTVQTLTDGNNKCLRLENIAQQNQQAFRIMFENTHDAIIHLNQDGFVVNTNETIQDIFGLSREEVLGKDLSDYDFLGFDYRQALELYKKAATDVPFPAFEVEAFHKNGARIFIETQAKPIVNGNKIEGIINIVRNITPQKRLENTKNATILGLAKLAESRDDCTGGHLERVREYSRMITRAISQLSKYIHYITPAYINDIYLSSILHDIGKVSVPDAILLKPGRLTADEFDIIKQHTIVGGNALAAVDAELKEQSFLTLGKEIAYYHHEAWNGNGYPEGLAGESIPLSARIVALADVYDALTTKRVYKDAYSHEKAVDIIMEEKGKKFDPEIVDAFAANLDEFDRIRLKINDDIPALYHLPRSSICCA